MKCSTHPDVDAVGVCVNCGRAVCSTCRTVVGGKTYCPACAAGVPGEVKRKLTAKPIAGGILGITAGVLGLVLGVILIGGGATTDYYTDYYWESVDWFAVGLGIAAVVFGILAIIGSSFAFGRKNFTLSVIGGVCALLALWPLGIPSLILIAMSRSEFQPAYASPICPSCGRDNPRGARFCMNCGRELPGPRD